MKPGLMSEIVSNNNLGIHGNKIHSNEYTRRFGFYTKKKNTHLFLNYVEFYVHV